MSEGNSTSLDQEGMLRADALLADSSSTTSTITSGGDAPAQITLKRRASPSLETLDDDDRRKRLRSDSSVAGPSSVNADGNNRSANFLEDLVSELQCGCCSEILYKPVLVSPCQHVFCGS